MAQTPHINVAVLDMQPIHPPIGGGRLRLLGLYHALGPHITARYVGTYDWPGETYRDHHLTPTLREIDVPLSAAHHAAARELSTRAGGKALVDIAFPRQVHESPEFLAKAREAIEWAHVVIFSHPWVFSALAPSLNPSHLVIYDAHNVEALLRSQLLDESNPVEAQLLRDVIQTELALGDRADLILVCSNADLELFARLYEWPPEKIRVVPNGVMASHVTPPTPRERTEAKQRLGLSPSRLASIFIGTDFGPNREAANFIVTELAWRLPICNFVVAGDVSASVSHAVPRNVFLTFRLSEEDKLTWLQACDFALNPMLSGSGTNIKMFDFMAAGLPVICTSIGSRGICTAGRDPFIVLPESAEDYAEAIANLIKNPDDLARRSLEARACVQDAYAWEDISPTLGRLLQKWQMRRRRPRPLFSVVIPTLDRHLSLDALLVALGNQIDSDFEVIVVDQTSDPWPNRDNAFDFPITYIRSRVKGAARARNTGAFYAQGKVLAFTDDDCLPTPSWLQAARSHFTDDSIHAVEGFIESDHYEDPLYRPVTNEGFEGLGFMTANLLVRAGTFYLLGGFDLNFDRPSFREDTDLGWRIQELGRTPYAPDVRVFHPAQLRSLERESHEERAKLFEKDALLLSRHPEKYLRLFEMERHWDKTIGFWENFERGATKYCVDISPYFTYKHRSSLFRNSSTPLGLLNTTR